MLALLVITLLVALTSVSGQDATAEPKDVVCTLATVATACATGEVCMLAKGTCADKATKGVCSKKPEICPTVVTPVCGCNKKNYSSECVALSNGHNTLADGNCKGTDGSLVATGGSIACDTPTPPVCKEDGSCTNSEPVKCPGGMEKRGDWPTVTCKVECTKAECCTGVSSFCYLCCMCSAVRQALVQLTIGLFGSLIVSFRRARVLVPRSLSTLTVSSTLLSSSLLSYLLLSFPRLSSSLLVLLHLQTELIPPIPMVCSDYKCPPADVDDPDAPPDMVCSEDGCTEEDW
jgi:hypothetical protein